MLYLKLDRLDEAAETLQRAAKINKRFYFPRLNLGVVLNRQGKYAEAVEVLGRLYGESPNFQGLSLTYADALVGAGQAAKAKKVLGDALAGADLERAAQVEAHYKLGMILSREENYAAAVAELEKAVGLDPEAANARLLLGQLYLSQQKPEQARRALEQYLKDMPAAPNAAQVRETVEKIKQALKQN